MEIATEHVLDIRDGVMPSLRYDHRQTRRLRAELTSPQAKATLATISVLATGLGLQVAIWEFISGQHSTVHASAAMMSILVLIVRGDLRPRMVPDVTSLVKKVVVSVTVAVSIALLGSVVLSDRMVPGDWLVLIFSTVLAVTLLSVVVGIFLLRALWRRNRLRSRAVLVGTSILSIEFGVEIGHHRSYGVDVVGLVGPAPLGGPIPHLGGYAEIPAVIESHGIDHLIVMPGATDSLVAPMRWANFRAGLQVSVVPRFYEIGLGMDSVSPDRVRGFPVTELARAPYRASGLRAKRIFDATVAGVGLLLASPMIAAIAATLKLSSRHESPLFRQERIGQFGEPFEILKFRSMTTSTASDQEWMGQAEARVTRLGAFLRKTSLDEIPQLFNVLKGDMSLVGPRPERPYYVEQFSDAVPGYHDRHRMPVGLTGLAQIVGLRGDTSIKQRVKFDNIYIDQWRFIWDLEIMVKTLWAVIKAHRYASDATAVENQLEAELRVLAEPLPSV